MPVQLVALSAAAAAALLTAPSAMAAPDCGGGRATAARIGEPAAATAWRAVLVTRTRIWRSVPEDSDRSRGVVGPEDASALLIMRAARDRDGRCWLLVRLPSRPNNARGWVRADRVVLRSTQWRIVVSRRARTLTAYQGGNPRRRFRVVVGAPGTSTPDGLFSIIGVWRWNSADFLGSYILPLTAHSNVLQEFGGGDGRVGIHGRGGASLLDPLGSARSHGCIRMSNRPIKWLVRRVGSDGLPGIPVRVR
jgi:L,D-transpeptidase-like protein